MSVDVCRYVAFKLLAKPAAGLYKTWLSTTVAASDAQAKSITSLP